MPSTYGKETAAAYERMYDQYAQKREDTTTPPDLIADFEKIGRLHRNSYLLEVGIGLGIDAELFLDRYNYTGIEPSVRFAANFQRRFHRPGVRVINQDIVDATFNPESFDAIWAMAVYHHLTDEEINAVLAKNAEWLKPNGVLYMSFKEGDFEGFKGDGRYFNYQTLEKIEAMMPPTLTIAQSSVTPPQEYNSHAANWLNIFAQKNT